MRELNWKEKLLVVGGTSSGPLNTSTVPELGTVTVTATAPSGGSGGSGGWGSFSVSQFIGQLGQWGVGSGLECVGGATGTALAATTAETGVGAAGAAAAGVVTAGACLNFAATPLGKEAFQLYEDDLLYGPINGTVAWLHHR